MFLALPNFSFSQVQIEEEIVLKDILDEEPDSLMPFYGRLRYELIGGVFTTGWVNRISVDIARPNYQDYHKE
jgi:hypothetical protein